MLLASPLAAPRQPQLFSSEDVVEQGNTLPLVPLNIDPPEIQMQPLEELLLNPKTGDRIILAKLNDPEPVEEGEE